MHLVELSSFLRGFVLPTDRAGGKTEKGGGSDRYPVNQRRLSGGMDYIVSSEFKLRGIHRENKRRHEKLQAGRHAFDAHDG